MPLYEYECKKCGEVVEELRKLSERTTNRPKCPSCGKVMANKISVFVAQMRGYSPMHPRALRGQKGR